MTPPAAPKRRHQHIPRNRFGYFGPPRAWVLTPEGAAVSRGFGKDVEGEAGHDLDAASDGLPQRLVPSAAVTSGHHANCPPSIRHLCRGELPAGWVREVADAS